MRKIYASIELNNQSLRLVVAELIGAKLYVLAAKEGVTEAITHGQVTDMTALSKDIIALKNEVETMVGIDINKVITVVDANRAGYQLVSGYSTITNDHGRVTADDIDRAIQASVYNKISEYLELVTVLPVEFMVDDKVIDQPLNQTAKKLSVKGIMVTVPKVNAMPVIQAIDNAGIETVDIVIPGIADYYYLFHRQDNDKRGVIVNVNNDTTTVSYFNKGLIVNSEVIYVGLNNVVKDLSYVFNLKLVDAKRLLERFALATTRVANVNEITSIFNNQQEELNLNQYEVSEVVMARLVEIFKLTKMSIKNLTNKEINYIMFTGATSEIPGFDSLLSEMVGTGIKIGDVTTMGARHNGYVSLLGGIYYYVFKNKVKGKTATMYSMVKNIDVKQPKNNMLDKIFNYFKED